MTETTTTERDIWGPHTIPMYPDLNVTVQVPDASAVVTIQMDRKYALRLLELIETYKYKVGGPDVSVLGRLLQRALGQPEK